MAEPKAYRSPTGDLIIGTAEIIEAVSCINGINDDGSPSHCILPSEAPNSIPKDATHIAWYNR